MKFITRVTILLLLTFSTTSQAILCPYLLLKIFSPSKAAKTATQIISSVVSDDVDPSATDEIIRFLVEISFDENGDVSPELFVRNTIDRYRAMGGHLYWANQRERQHLPIDQPMVNYDVHGMRALELVMKYYPVFSEDEHNRQLAENAQQDYLLLIRKFSVK